MDMKMSPAERVTAQIKAALEQGARPWAKPWVDGMPLDLAGFVLPLRSCGTPYRGINTLALWCSAQAFGFKSRKWYTFKQAQALGANVRKGEHGSYVVYYTQFIPKAEAEAVKAGDVADLRPRSLLKGYTVFNADQIDGLEPETFDAPHIPQEPDAVDAWFAPIFARVPAVVRTGGNRAFFSPSADVVQMPLPVQFRDRLQYYATLSHELAHWTGHESRLARQFGSRFGDTDYALEELVAELASAMVGAELGMPCEHVEDHAAYIQSWLSALKDRPSAFLHAAAKAQEAADLLMSHINATPLAIAA